MKREIHWVESKHYLPLDEFRQNPKNPKKHTKKQIENIMNSILEFGFDDAVGVWGEDNIIVEGHGRIKALKQLVSSGMIEIPEIGVPCVRLDHMSEAERDAYMLEHNQANMETDFDDDILDDLLKDLSKSGIEMEKYGFEIKEESEEEGYDAGHNQQCL